MITVTEFLHPLKNKSVRKISLAVLYFALRYENTESLTVEDVKGMIKRGRLAKAAKSNIADALSKSAPYVETCGKKDNRLLWRLTSTGEKFVRQILELPEHDVEVQHDISSLDALLKNIGHEYSRAFVEEALTCLKVNALRAAIVFLWAGAIRIIQEGVMKKGVKKVNAALSKYESNPRAVKKIDDLSYFKDSTLLLVAQELGLFDKNERSVLQGALDLRNKCGHAGKYSPGPKRASSFIEDLMTVVFCQV